MLFLDFPFASVSVSQAHKAGGCPSPYVSWLRVGGSSSRLATMATPRSEAAVVSFADGESATSIIPPIYFSDSFDLKDPETFESLLISSAPLALQQKLTLFLDKVEDEIATLVRSRADDFVAALSTLQVLLLFLKNTIYSCIVRCCGLVFVCGGSC